MTRRELTRIPGRVEGKLRHEASRVGSSKVHGYIIIKESVYRTVPASASGSTLPAPQDGQELGAFFQASCNILLRKPSALAYIPGLALSGGPATLRT